MRRKYGLRSGGAIVKKYWTIDGAMRGMKRLEEKYNIESEWVVIKYHTVWE